MRMRNLQLPVPEERKLYCHGAIKLLFEKKKDLGSEA